MKIANAGISFEYQQAKKKFMRKAWPYRCARCGFVCKKGERTVDHIIPRTICLRLGKPELITDPANFQVMHPACNNLKADNLI